MEPIQFEKNKDLFNGDLSTGIQFSSQIDKSILKAIEQNDNINNLQLPIVLGDGKVTASGEQKKFEFKGNKEISIDGSLEGFLRIGVFGSTDEILKDLIGNDKLNLDLDQITGEHAYVLFSLGYKIEAEVQGKWVLGYGSLNAGISGGKAQRMAVLKKVKREDGIRDVIRDTISQLRSPKQIDASSDLDPGTHLVVQSRGSFNGSFGAQVGYDFNWIYESETPGLTGTVGLQAKLGAQLGVGFSVAGQYALALSRENTADELRLRMYKQRKNGWSFALSLAASLKADLDDYNETSLDDLIKATIGIHYSQIIEDLAKIRELTDPEKLTEKLNGLTDKLLRAITDSTNIDESYEVVRKKLIKLLDKWEAVGEDPGATLWKLLDEKVANSVDIDLDGLKQKFEKIANASQKDVQDFLEQQLGEVGYQNTAFGKLLNSILPQEDIISALVEIDQFERLQDRSKSLVSLLNLEDKVEKFHETISDLLNLEKIQEAVKQNDFDKLGDWLKGKLEDLIMNEAGELVMEKLKEIDNFIDNLREKSEEIIEKTKKALQKEYGFSLAYNYQKEKEKSALIDAFFAFGKPNVPEVFKQTLDGNLDKLLTEPIEGVRLKQGILSHGIKKQRTISLTLPFIKRDFTNINNSIATGKFIEEQDGRLIMYEFEAEDTIRRSKRLSQLALEGFYRGKKSSDGFEQSDESISLSYSFKLAKKRFKTKHLEQVIEPFIRRYLSSVFDNNAVTAKKSTDDWIQDMDDQIDAINNNGRRNFGRTMLNLELRIPSAIGSAWFKAPDDPNDSEYVDISNAIQQRLREVVPLYFLENEDAFSKSSLQDELYTVLTYKSLPIVTDFKFKNGQLKRHWNYKAELVNKLKKNHTKETLARSLGEIKSRLFHDPDPEIQKLADKFDTLTTGQRDDILNQASTQGSLVNSKIRRLLSIENDIIKSVISAGTRLAKFLDDADESPEAAIQGLQQFGSIVTHAFNKNSGIKIIASRRDYTRYLGPELFIAVAQALDPTLEVNTQGTLELLVLKNSSDFEINNYLDGEVPNVEDLIISHRILDFS